MQTLDNISSNQFANSVMSKIDTNFTKVRNAINALEQSGGGSSGGGETTSETRHILMLGNSFTANGCEHLAKICNNLGLNNTNNSVQRVYADHSNLQEYSSLIATDGTISSLQGGEAVANVFGTGFSISTSNKISELFGHDWDIIVFQQKSAGAKDYNTFVPYLSKLIDCAIKNCTNRNVKFMVNMPWEALASSSQYSSIITAHKSMMEDYGHIITLIPSGTALENLRGTSLNDGNDFTYDNWHLADGAGRYTAACILFQSFFAGLVSGNLYDDTTTITEMQTGTSGGNDVTVGQLAVTDANRLTLQKSAMYAYIHPWGVTDIDNL